MTQTLAEVKRHGRHYTPAELAEFLAERVAAHLSTSKPVRVLDPACGDGELLFAISRALEATGQAEIQLVGYDLDPEALEVAASRARQQGVVLDLCHGDFLQAEHELARGSFDAVITNPPYVRTQQLGQETAQVLARQFALSGRIDLTHPFVALLPELLRQGGVIGLLCSNRFMTTRAGSNVRRVLQTSLSLVELYDLGDTKLFNAAVLPAVVVALNKPSNPLDLVPFAAAYEDGAAAPSDGGDLFGALVSREDISVNLGGRTISVRHGALARVWSAEEPWRLSHQAGDEWLRSVEAATWKTFGDVAKIRVGIKTTADAVFISDKWEAARPRPENEVLLPLITHDNLTAWSVSEHLPTQVLYPYDLDSPKRRLLDMGKLPAAMTYLESHAERLKGRKYVIEGGREWFEIWVPQQPAKWALPKIVFPDISVEARFALDRSGAVVNGDCYWISLDDIGDEDVALLMLAVANSSFGVRFYDEVCGNKLYAGRRRWMTQYVSRLPLPDPEAVASRELIAVVRSVATSGAAPTSAQLAEIDRLVEASFEKPVERRDSVAAQTLL